MKEITNCHYHSRCACSICCDHKKSLDKVDRSFTFILTARKTLDERNKILLVFWMVIFALNKTCLRQHNNLHGDCSILGVTCNSDLLVKEKN